MCDGGSGARVTGLYPVGSSETSHEDEDDRAPTPRDERPSTISSGVAGKARPGGRSLGVSTNTRTAINNTSRGFYAPISRL